MEYRILGKTGLKISRMGFGGIPIQRTDAEKTKELITLLHRQGVNYIDTARAYTVSEEYLGYALEGIRQDFVLATKSGAKTKEAMAADIDVSLKNLRTDYIDLYQVHNPSPAGLDEILAPGGALEALLEAKAAGKIGHIGITLHTVDLFQRAVEFDWVETIMFPYNIVETQGEALIHTCAQRNIGFIAMKPLAGGAIDDPVLALRFIANNPDVTVVIPGMATKDEVSENMAAVCDNTPLTEEELAKLQTVRDQLGTQFCRRCNYCAPCTAGIGISVQFLLEGYYTRYNLEDWAQKRYDAQEKKASDCIGCGACEPRCPYQLPIRDMMKRVATLFEKK
ncbi:MAG: aldo/keto reductase [Oscillospiraceae bacterium]|nr:aldo/keto reductase [Oscillospiraceae bacterium]